MNTKRRVLAVDDNETNLAILEELLEDYELRKASSGEECLRVAQEFEPDLVLLDIMMPGIDGYETCRKLRQSDQLSVRETKVIMVSAKAMLSERLEGYESGADDYITKPFDPDELLSKVRVYLRLLSVEASQRETQRLNEELCAANEGLLRAQEESEALLRNLEVANARLREEMGRRKSTEEQMRHAALHDVLTDLPNRALLCDRIDQCIRRTQRDSEYRFAVLFLDVDDFKVVNDSLGHPAGDAYLVELARRLVSALRGTDCASRISEGTTARVGGDEFVVLLDGLREADDFGLVAERLQNVLSHPLTVDGNELRPSVSLGIALGTSDYESADDVLRDADTALYRAKDLGKRQAVVFDAEMRTEAVARMRMEGELRRAVDEDQFSLAYQPIVDLATGRIHGFEALMRWYHEDYGDISPVEFIPLAEQTGLIMGLGEWVLHTACSQIAEWRRRFVDRRDLTISVNFSAKQFSSPQLVEQIDSVLEQTGLERSCLNLELTETVLMKHASPGAMVLEQLSTKNTNIHMDDFGTGYSSLSYLARLPISALKVDRSIVSSLITSEADWVMMKGVVEMAHARGVKVVAEGIETLEQADLLRELGCDLGQGFYFSVPLKARDAERLLEANEEWPRLSA